MNSERKTIALWIAISVLLPLLLFTAISRANANITEKADTVSRIAPIEQHQALRNTKYTAPTIHKPAHKKSSLIGVFM